MDYEIVSPDQEDEYVDRQNPQHEDENRVGEVGKVVMRSGSLHVVSYDLTNRRRCIQFP